MRFEEAYTGWQEGRLTQAEAARLLGVCERTLRRQIGRYETDGMDGLIDKRLTQLSHKRAPVDEVMGLADLYRSGYSSWNVQHFHTWYIRDHGGHAAIPGSRTSCSKRVRLSGPKRAVSTARSATANRCRG